jgi:hypothetical protein
VKARQLALRAYPLLHAASQHLDHSRCESMRPQELDHVELPRVCHGHQVPRAIGAGTATATSSSPCSKHSRHNLSATQPGSEALWHASARAVSMPGHWHSPSNVRVHDHTVVGHVGLCVGFTWKCDESKAKAECMHASIACLLFCVGFTRKCDESKAKHCHVATQHGASMVSTAS